MTYLFLRLVHILAMALWFGAALFAPGDIRRTLGKDDTDLSLLQDRMKRVQRFSAIGGWTTVLTGVALIFVMGGFGAVPVAIHIGLGLSLVALGVGIFGVGMGTRKIDAGISAGKPRAELLALSKRVTISSGIFQLLWLVILTLMVFRGVVQ